MAKIHRLKRVNKHRVKGTTAGEGTAAGKVPDDSTEYWYSKKHLDRSGEYAP